MISECALRARQEISKEVSFTQLETKGPKK